MNWASLCPRLAALSNQRAAEAGPPSRPPSFKKRTPMRYCASRSFVAGGGEQHFHVLGGTPCEPLLPSVAASSAGPFCGMRRADATAPG